MSPKILIFSIAMGANHLFELKFIETYASQFFGHNNTFLGVEITLYHAAYIRKREYVILTLSQGP